MKVNFKPIENIRDKTISDLDELMISLRFELLGTEDLRKEIYSYHYEAMELVEKEISLINSKLYISTNIDHSLNNFIHKINDLKINQFSIWNKVPNGEKFILNKDLYDQDKIVSQATRSNYLNLILDYYKGINYLVTLNIIEGSDYWDDSDYWGEYEILDFITGNLKLDKTNIGNIELNYIHKYYPI